MTLLSDLFRLVNSLFARIINKRCKRRGQVIMDRFKSPVTPPLRRKNYLLMITKILGNDWKEKRSYSSVAFIGNPDWVQARMDQLKTFQSLQRKSWRTRFLERFGSAA